MIECQTCSSTFEKIHWNHLYCSTVCRDEYRRLNYQAAWSAKYASKSPRTFMARLLNKKRHSKKGVSLDHLMNLYDLQGGLCALSGEFMTYTHGDGLVVTNISLDKIDPSKGYTEGNIQLVCRVVNSMKYTENKEDLISWCKKIVEHNK